MPDLPDPRGPRTKSVRLSRVRATGRLGGAGASRACISLTWGMTDGGCEGERARRGRGRGDPSLASAVVVVSRRTHSVKHKVHVLLYPPLASPLFSRAAW